MKTAAPIIALLAGIQGTSALTTLRQEAAKKDILIGSGAINPSYLDDPQFATVLAQQFNSLSPENELKWNFIHPTEDYYDWSKIDRLVAFAEDHDMVVKGHGLISSCCNPDYLLNLTDPTELRSAMTAHFEAIMHRYNGKVDRWDVVTEVLETLADQDAKLFINENQVEAYPGKRQELYNLVSGLVADGVPIDGVALQMHVTEGVPVPQGVIMEMVNSFNALGLETTIAELDVHTLNATLQTEIYGDLVSESLHAGITDVSFWGFTDKHAYTWIEGAKPLMFDECYHPKGAYYATHAALRSFVNGH
ncbi:glycoside hydrolase superfamily [Aspergillus falconensis]